MLPLLLTLATLATPPAPRPPLPERLAVSISRRLPARLGARRQAYAGELARAIVREAHRRGLDPLALAAVGWVESDWQAWRTRAGDGSHGVWQLIARQSASRAAGALLLGCEPGPRLPAHWRRWWARWGRGEPCEAPEVARRRHRLGAWSVAELRDPVIGTFIAAYSVRRHVLACHARRHGPHRHPACRGLGWLTRWGHYNSGWNRPRWYYLQRLCTRYQLLRAEVGR